MHCLYFLGKLLEKHSVGNDEAFFPSVRSCNQNAVVSAHVFCNPNIKKIPL